MIAPLLDELRTSHDFYVAAVGNAQHQQTKALLERRAQLRNEFITELTGTSQEATGDSADDNNGLRGDPLDALRRGLTTFTAGLTIEPEKTDRLLLEDGRQVDESLLETYAATLEQDPPARLRAVVERQYNQLQADLAYDRTRAGAPAAMVDSGDAPRSLDATTLALFSAEADARTAIQALQEAGFGREQLGVVAQEEGLDRVLDDNRQELARESAGIGALGGTAVGGLVGLLTGASFLIFPGLGALVAAGATATALGITATGAGIGASYGALFGALLGWSTGEEATQRYLAGLQNGEILLAVHGPAEDADRARRILRESGGHDLETRRLDPA